MGRAIAVDWSGARPASAQRRAIWVAVAEDGVLRSLVGGFTREEAVEDVRRRLWAGASVAGFDFSFSFPGWFVRAAGADDGPGVWDVVARDGEAWLAACAPPFWGRRGRPRPRACPAQPEWRRTEAERPPGARRPKPTFQVGGAGSVGTAAVRGMPHLRVLRAAGVAVWPFDSPPVGGPVVAEVYPRWATGPVVKSRAEARARHMALLDDAVPPALAALAAGSEDAFDAACAALALSAAASCFPSTDDLDRLEGRILPLPQTAAPDLGRGARRSRRTTFTGAGKPAIGSPSGSLAVAQGGQ